MSMPEKIWAEPHSGLKGASGSWNNHQDFYKKATPYRRLDPDLLIISREELEALKPHTRPEANMEPQREATAVSKFIDQLLERIG